MVASREAVAGGLLHIEQQIDALEAAIENNAGLVFDLAKTIIESVCKSLLANAGRDYGTSDDLPKLFKIATSSLPLLPTSASGAAEVRASLVQTLNALATAVQGMCELRNKCGFASHGYDQSRPELGSAQAIFVASAADAIVGLMYRASRPGMSKVTRELRYEDHAAFNEATDAVHDPIVIFDEEFLPSVVLFKLAPEPYRFNLGEFFPVTEEVE